MIGKLQGKFDGVTLEGAALLDVGGVGYAVRTTAATISSIRAESRDTLSLFIHMVVRDDAIDLYGFPSDEELVFFKQLMSVSGIGPKSALAVLNAADVNTLKRSIAQGDSTMLTKVFGIGKKSAERIVVELRDRFATEFKKKGGGDAGGPQSEDLEVVEALMALGYSAVESRDVLSKVGHDVTGVRERLSAALRQLGTHS